MQDPNSLNLQPGDPYPVMTTGDGSLSFYSSEFGQFFHNVTGARQEALEKFARPCGVEQLAKERAQIRVLDVCFGLGYNAGVALEVVQGVNPDCRMELLALERSADVPQQAVQKGILFGDPQVWKKLIEQGRVETDPLVGQMLWGDARQKIGEVPLAWADVVFFDPFSPSACCELWTVEFLREVRLRMRAEGRLATYSCGAAVRQAMLEAGFYIGSTPAVGRPWPGTVASPGDPNLSPLPLSEQEHLQTRAAVPYRDPDLTWDREQIRRDRVQRQQRSNLESTGAWKRRWGIP